MISIVAALGLLGPIPGCGQLIIDLVLRPRVDFEAQPLSPRPSYEQTEAWLAHPSVDDPSDRLPEGIEPVPDAERPAALFFVAPTTWFGKQAWNDPLDDDKTQTLTRTMLAGEASPFSAAARIYAPRYRQATAYAFTVSNDDAIAARELAYGDVLAAFDYFVEQLEPGRPFLLASHSQGTAHAMRLIEERIAGTPLAERFVAGYLLGYRLPTDVFSRTMPGIEPCTRPGQTRCVVAWDTVAEGADMAPSVGHPYAGSWEPEDGKAPTCINPLSWRDDSARVDATEHAGAVPIDMRAFWKALRKKRPRLEVPDPLPAVLPQRISAQCHEGLLWVSDPDDRRFKQVAKSYHSSDFLLFWLDLRLDSTERVEAWLGRVP